MTIPAKRQPITDARSAGTRSAAEHVRTFEIDEVVLTIELVAPGIVSVYRARTGAAAQAPSPAIVSRSFEHADCRWDGSVGSAGPLYVSVDEVTGGLTFSDASGVLTREHAATVSTAGPQHLTFAAQPTEQFYGLGQKVRGADDTSLSWRNRVRTFGPFGNAREKTCPGVAGQGNGNTTIPLVVSTAGFGLFLDNHYRHEWDFTGETTWSVSAAAGEHRYWFLYGPDTAAVLERFTALTGRAPMPPRWALGLLQSKFGYRDWNEVRAAADAYRACGIPCDAIILDLYWFGGVPHFGGARRIGSLEWDESHFPDAAAEIAALGARGFRTMVVEEPYIDEQLPAFGEAAALGHLARNSDGSPGVLEKWWGRGGLVDMTNPAAREWWWRRHRPLVQDGVAGWWTDLSEPDTFDADARYHDAASHADVHNRFALEWARALHDGSRTDRPSERVFQLTRSGYAGIQRYGAALWSNDVMADFQWLAPQPATGINLGLSGIPWWGSDVGGFIGPVASDELYVRWFQFGAFSPIFRTHGQNRPTAPFEFPPPVERICADYARLRYRLLPYIYTAAREAHDTGMPLMRALACDFPDDPTVSDLGSQYLFGPSIMVAPMLSPGNERDVYLPAGDWVDFWSGEVYAGPAWLRRWPAPLGTLPLFVRSGSIITLGPDLAWTGERPLDPLTLRVYPGHTPASSILYEDDGCTTAYEHGEFATTVLGATTSFASDGSPRAVHVELGAMTGGFPGAVRERSVMVEIVAGRRVITVPLPPASTRWRREVTVFV